MTKFFTKVKDMACIVICAMLTISCASGAEAANGYTKQKDHKAPPLAPSPIGLSLQFYATGTSARVVDPIENRNLQKWVSIGIITGDSVTFTAVFNPAQPLPASSYSWSGAVSGHGSSITIPFDAPGQYWEEVTVQGQTRLAKIVVKTVAGMGLDEYAALHWRTWMVGTSTGMEAETWSKQTDSLFGLINGKADAGRHIYWTALMTTKLSEDSARNYSNAHEVTDIANGNSHNETVMDLHNDEAGITVGLANESQDNTTLQNATVQAVNTGKGIIIDDARPNYLGNVGRAGLLVQSDKIVYHDQ